MELLKTPGATDFLDIALVALLIYSFQIWFRRTRAAFVALGLVILALIYALARFLGLTMTVMIFKGFFAVVVITIVVIFQEEIRQIFERIAILSFLGGANASISPRDIDTIMRSVSNFARDKIGALIVLQGLDPLERHIEGGWELNGELSQPLLESIFDWHSLGHDGAVLIGNGRVTKFGCQLPLSRNVSASEHPGTRHTAALGLAEKTDALAIVVSEEKGTIAVAQEGTIKTVHALAELQRTLELFLAEKAPKPPQRKIHGLFTQNLREKAVALILSAVMWVFFSALRPR